MKLLGTTFTGSAIDDEATFKRLPKNLQSLLQQENGFIAFDGGLHLRGACLSPAWHSLREVWAGEFALHELYPVINKTDVPFAQDCLGDQFILRQDVVHRLSSETGELDSLEISIETFFVKAEANPVEFLSLQPLLQFMREGGKLEPGQLLSVYPPFCTKESANGVSLRAIAMFDCLESLAGFARQISALP
ncbi:MAG: hypothetical protein MSG64_10880 [Pyrinomonadaceae bacterium MAG19_C2-C3]|nr:hypothetical protein [Pyrinomonadaceae bacterium MAG19_C2-C3]